jgi:hypothetical protein
MNDEIIKIDTEMRLGILPASTPHDVIVQASSIAKELAKIVKENRLSRNIQGREYVYVEGWSTMGAMLGVLPREVADLTKRNEDGSYEATVELIRTTDGAIVGRASALVGMDETDRNGKTTWGSRPEYARRSMAITRATGKAYRLGFSWIMGLAGYAPTPAEEMDGVIDAEVVEVKQQSKPAPKPKPEESTNGNRPYSPASVRDRLRDRATSHMNYEPTEKQQQLLRYGLELCFAGEAEIEDKRHTVLHYLTGSESTKDVDGQHFKALVEDWLDMKKDSGGEYTVNKYAVQEAHAIYDEAVKAEGQAELEL